jgi:recombination protein RecA
MENEGLNQAKDLLIKKYGEGTIMPLSAKPIKMERLSTGIPELDEILGGGLPHGRIVEIYGNEGGGKTTLALHILASCQKTYRKKVVFVDAEHSLNPEYAQRLGVNLDDVEFSQPDYGEQALEIVENMTRSGDVGVIVVDSVAALTPQAEIEGEMSDQQIGLQARLIGKAMRKLCAIAGKTKTHLIFINQIREKCGRVFGNPETTPGGRALKFYSSVRLQVTYTGKEKHTKDGKEIVDGQTITIKTIKNKTYPPFKKCELFIKFDEGIKSCITAERPEKKMRPRPRKEK